MKTSLTYGALISVVGAVINLVLYLAGYHSSASKLETSNSIVQIVGLLSLVVGLLLAMRAARSKSADGSLSYGQAVGTGALTGVFTGIFSSAFTLLYGYVINPEFHEIFFELMMSKAPPAQAEAAEGMMRFFTGPLWAAIAGVIFVPIISTIISLILAAFVKRAPQTPPPV